MSEDYPSWSGERVLKRWQASPTELASYIYRGLPAYYMKEGKLRQVDPKELNRFDMDHMTDLLFIPSEIESFEKKDEQLRQRMTGEANAALKGEEAQELGRLRNEKDKWDASIVAALHIGLYCAQLDHSITRAELADEVYKVDPKIPDTTIEKIWKAIPIDLRKAAGRPKKE